MLNCEPLDARATDEAICAAAGRYAKRVRNHVFTQSDTVRTQHEPATLTFELNAVAAHCGIACIDPDVTLAGRVGRMVDPMFWRRNLRKATLLENERIERTAGAVCKRRQAYVSDHAVRAKRLRRTANRATLENMEVVNEAGDCINLLELADRSISNPAIRRGELMVRLRGFEEVAEYMGHAAVFLTITCPSRFHRFSGAGYKNKNWTDETPKDAQKYLSGVFAKIRAKWGRNGFFPYGFRVSEPHLDGCVHWHVLLYMPTEQVGWFNPDRFAASMTQHGRGVVGIAGEYALAESRTERGAVEQRFDYKLIDLEKGSATGYIAKYISKNIDGLRQDGGGMGLDYETGTHAELSSERVQAWAKTHGLRQFQQIGGPSVTVWRELRRLGKEEERMLQEDIFEGPRLAAVQARWDMFWLVQGGPDTKRKNLPLRPLYETKGEGKYGETVTRVQGVKAIQRVELFEGSALMNLYSDELAIDELQTRLHTWTVQRAGLEDTNEFCADRLAVQASVRRIQAAFGPGFFDPAPVLKGREATPWTGINNCTEEETFEELERDENDVLYEELVAMWAAKAATETDSRNQMDPKK